MNINDLQNTSRKRKKKTFTILNINHGKKKRQKTLIFFSKIYHIS